MSEPQPPEGRAAPGGSDAGRGVSGGSGRGDARTGSGGRWLRVALVVSVGLNLLVAGFVAGRALDDRARVAPRAAPADIARSLGFGPYFAALAPADRRAIGRAVRDTVRARGGSAAARTEVRESFEAVLSALRADPFDPDALSSLLARQVERAEARRRMGQEAFVAHLSRMTPQARRAFADRLETRLRGHAGDGGP